MRAALLSPLDNMSTTSTAPPPRRLNFRPVDWQVAPSVDTIASACGLSPESTGLIMAAIIGGLNRRKPGHVPGILDGVPAGPNVLLVGADENPRVRRLLSMLLQPLTSAQGILREAAGNCRRDTLDLLRFGPESGEDASDPTRDLLNRIKQGPFSEDLLGLGGWGAGGSSGRELIAANRPSVYLANAEADTLLAGLEEALDGQLLVFDEHGDLFHLLAAPSRGDRGKADRIRALIGQQGSDVPLRHPHPRRGPGSLEVRQLNMVSSISRQRIVSLLEHKGSRLRTVLEQFLVMDARAGVPAPSAPPSFKELSDALHWWTDAVSSVYSARIFGRGTGPAPPENIADHLMLVTADFHQVLGEKSNESHVSRGNLWALPLQLYLALAVVSRTGANGEAAVLPNLDRLCARALEKHVNALARLQDEATGNELTRRRESILRAIGRHGPCTFRIMVRTFSVQRKDLYEPLVCELIEEGEVIEMDDGLLALPAAGKNRLESRERRLN